MVSMAIYEYEINKLIGIKKVIYIEDITCLKQPNITALLMQLKTEGWFNNEWMSFKSFLHKQFMIDRYQI